jgi:hypothetical protein
MSTTHPATTAKIRKHDIDAASDTSWVNGLTPDQARFELEAELQRVTEIEPGSAYVETVKYLRIAALEERLYGD